MNRFLIASTALVALAACKSQIEKDCEKKVEGLASVFGKADIEKPDWAEKKATAVKKCVENGSELRPGR